MSVAMEDGSRRRRITVDEYHRMAGAGLLAPDARAELIEGEIVDMPPIGSRHAAAVDHLAELLHAAIGPRAIVRCQGPIRLGDLSEPQPDFAVLARCEDRYRDRYPTAPDVLLLIEVSDTTLRFDLHTKAALYAAHGIRELWVFDAERAELHVLRSPGGRTYTDITTTAEPSMLPLPAMPGVAVDLSSLFRTLRRPAD
jgi:Uma2 family endonuclease